MTTSLSFFYCCTNVVFSDCPILEVWILLSSWNNYILLAQVRSGNFKNVFSLVFVESRDSDSKLKHSSHLLEHQRLCEAERDISSFDWNLFVFFFVFFEKYRGVNYIRNSRLKPFQVNRTVNGRKISPSILGLPTTYANIIEAAYSADDLTRALFVLGEIKNIRINGLNFPTQTDIQSLSAVKKKKLIFFSFRHEKVDFSRRYVQVKKKKTTHRFKFLFVLFKTFWTRLKYCVFWKVQNLTQFKKILNCWYLQKGRKSEGLKCFPFTKIILWMCFMPDFSCWGLHIIF